MRAQSRNLFDSCALRCSLHTVRAADALIGVARQLDGVGSAAYTIVHCE